MMRKPNPSPTLYVMQDGPDFYIYRESNCMKLHNTWTYPKPVGLSMEKAIEAREAFMAQVRLAGYTDIQWPNPFTVGFDDED